MSLLFKISQTENFRNPLGGNSHYLAEIYNKNDLTLNRKEPLCGEKNINDLKINNLENITCKLCNLVLKKLEFL